MLSQKHRLSKSADVKKTTARGRSFFNPYFIIKFIPGTDTKEPVKIAIITSVRVSKKAVDRNRVKRVLREEIRKYLPNFKSGNYAIIVRSSATKITSAELRESFAKSLVTGKIIK